jgi:hypothetical protein
MSWGRRLVSVELDHRPSDSRKPVLRFQSEVLDDAVGFQLLSSVLQVLHVIFGEGEDA